MHSPIVGVSLTWCDYIWLTPFGHIWSHYITPGKVQFSLGVRFDILVENTELPWTLSTRTKEDQWTPTRVSEHARTQPTSYNTMTLAWHGRREMRQPKVNLGWTTTLGDSEREGRIGLNCLSINPKRARMGSLLVLDCTLYILEYMWAMWGYP